MYRLPMFPRRMGTAKRTKSLNHESSAYPLFPIRASTTVNSMLRNRESAFSARQRAECLAERSFRGSMLPLRLW